MSPTPPSAASAATTAPSRPLLLELLVVVAAAHVAWIASALLVPIVGALLAALLLQPVVRMLRRCWVPRWLGALLALTIAVGGVGGTLYAVYDPAVTAMTELPGTIERAKKRILDTTHDWAENNPVDETITALTELSDGKPDPRQPRVIVEPPSFAQRALALGTVALGNLAASLILVYFFLVFGGGLLQRMIDRSPDRRGKQMSLDVARAIQAQIPRYMLTITCINVGLGLAVAGTFAVLGIRNPLLWGALATLVNFIPYLGPFVLSLLLFLLGLDQYETLPQAMLPALTYAGLNLIEGQVVTPTWLGRGFAINPLVIVIWLMIWGWLWGVPGFLLGVPMLVVVKVALEGLDPNGLWTTLLCRPPKAPRRSRKAQTPEPMPAPAPSTEAAS
ncbi:MAG: AI-2E family transporter [Xanthomonadales bacterium]|nr:AI-2E family transporter [Xanthomonadales bacterium]